MPESDFLKASYPLFEDGEVDALEWSFDMGFGRELPSWAEQLIDFFSKQDKLYGHGVTFSLLSAKTDRHHEQWRSQFAREVKQRNYVHISEHFGFMRASKFDFSAPLPVPYAPESVVLGQKRLLELAEICRPVPIGLENLALAFGGMDLIDQGAFLEDLLAPLNGFLLLDLHNIYCQMHNFKRSLEEILRTYPLHRVRELHISGGSWSRPATVSAFASGYLRRDTHDDSVPPEVFDLLPVALQLCPNVEVVVMERLGKTIAGTAAEEEFRCDFKRLKQLIASANSESIVTTEGLQTGAPKRGTPGRETLERGTLGQGTSLLSPTDEQDELLLARFQDALLDLLSGDHSASQIIERLKVNPEFRRYSGYVDTWEENMVWIGKELLSKWGSVSPHFAD